MKSTPKRRDKAGLPGGASFVAEGLPLLIDQIRRGYPWSLAHGFQEQLELKDGEFASVLGVSSRTLGRRRKGRRILNEIASDRLYRLMRVVDLAGSVFEEQELGLQWLRRPQVGLGGKVPLTLLDTQPGFEAVGALLQQIEYGAIS